MPSETSPEGRSDETIIGNRFDVVNPSERDVLTDQLSVTMYRIVDTDEDANTTVAYCHTYADAVFTARLMNAGHVLSTELGVALGSPYRREREQPST